MKLRLLAVLLAFVVPVASAQEGENPYRKAKVGDYSTYKITLKISSQNVEGTITQTVSEKSDREVTIVTTGTVNAAPIQPVDHKIDLTKAFDPTKTGGLAPGTQTKVEKGKDGTEKVKLGGKDYDTKWETFKVKVTANGMEFDTDMKVWQVKDLAMPMVKLEMQTEVAGNKMEVVMELTESGNKPIEKKKE